MDVPGQKNIKMDNSGNKPREKGGQATFSGIKNEKKGAGDFSQKKEDCPWVRRCHREWIFSCTLSLMAFPKIRPASDGTEKVACPLFYLRI
jgi:hypothetical protein